MMLQNAQQANVTESMLSTIAASIVEVYSEDKEEHDDEGDKTIKTFKKTKKFKGSYQDF